MRRRRLRLVAEPMKSAALRNDDDRLARVRLPAPLANGLPSTFFDGGADGIDVDAYFDGLSTMPRFARWPGQLGDYACSIATMAIAASAGNHIGVDTQRR